MDKNARTLALLAFAFIVTGCAGPVTKRSDVSPDLVENERQIQRELAENERQIQRDLEFTQWVQSIVRLNNLGFPIVRDNVELCGDDIKQSIGASITNKYFGNDEEIKDLLQRNLGLGDDLEVVSVAPGSPADKAGLEKGDVIKSMNSRTVPVGASAPSRYEELLSESIADGFPVEFLVSRNGKSLELRIDPVLICAPPLLVELKPRIPAPNAYTDGDTIFVNQAMMDFASDDELAIIIGHELAHCTMEHSDKKRMNAVGGLIVDILFAGLGVDTGGTATKIAGRAYSQEFEAEADYVGLYMTYRAGYPIDDAELFWRKMGIKLGGIENSGGTHPSSPERFIALSSTKEEIFAKEYAGEPLLPNLQE